MAVTLHNLFHELLVVPVALHNLLVELVMLNTVASNETCSRLCWLSAMGMHGLILGCFQDRSLTLDSQAWTGRKYSAFVPRVTSVSVLPTFYADEPDPNQGDSTRLDVVVSFADGRSVRYHPSAGPTWSDEAQPTKAMQQRYNRARKLAERLASAQAEV